MINKSILMCSVVLVLLLVGTSHADLVSGLALYSSMDTATAPTSTEDGVVPDAIASLDGALKGEASNVIYDAARGDNVLDLPGRTSAGTEYVDYGDILDMSTNSFSTSIWFKVESAIEGDGEIEMLASDSDGSIGWEMYCYAPNDKAARANGMVSVYVSDGSGNDVKLFLNTSVGGVNLRDWGWHHLAMTFDTTDDTVRAYFDGVGSGNTGTDNGWQIANGYYNQTGGNSLSNTSDVQLGYTAALDFDGQLDDFAVWNRVLSGSEISDIYGGATIVPEPSALICMLGLLVCAAFGRRTRR